MRAVRTTSAHQFADDNNMYTFLMSAKSGDQVQTNERVTSHINRKLVSVPSAFSHVSLAGSTSMHSSIELALPIVLRLFFTLCQMPTTSNVSRCCAPTQRGLTRPCISYPLQVDACFHRIAGHLSGIALSRPQLDAAGGVLSASIVNYRRHDEEVHGGELPDYTSRRPKTCTLS